MINFLIFLIILYFMYKFLTIDILYSGVVAAVISYIVGAKFLAGLFLTASFIALLGKIVNFTRKRFTH